MTTHKHPFHMVDMSPWPITSATGALTLMVGLTSWFHDQKMLIMLMSFIIIGISSIQWWRDMARESTLQGLHSKSVIYNLRWGMILFIVSEVLFFFSFFWTFFHSSMAPTIDIGNQWPPISISTFNPFQIPLLNTVILLSSGASITWSHHSIMKSNHSQTIQSLIITIILGIYFTLLQAMEYYEASFTISDNIYGATFFVATGFHGLHVIIGSTFIMICFKRMYSGHFSKNHHFGFEAAAWYWHFVDVVWLFLYTSIYWWGT